MSGNPHLYLLAKTMRSRSSYNLALLATRGGGGGHFVRPDPKIPQPYNFTRRYRLEDINTVLYHDFAPEYHMHLHSPIIQSTKKGVALILIFCVIVIFPVWWMARTFQKMAGSNLFFSVRPGKDHEHMAPALIKHLKENNFEAKDDLFGRRNAQFYKNICRQEMGIDMKPKNVEKLEKHGFKF